MIASDLDEVESEVDHGPTPAVKLGQVEAEGLNNSIVIKVYDENSE